MREGWWNDDYMILFEAAEIAAATDRYEVSHLLPGYVVIGLRGWDDLIVRDSDNRTFSVPAVPLVSKYLEPFSPPTEQEQLESDSRFAGKIKWYVQPLVFGGDIGPMNTIWVDDGGHAELVGFWNRTYQGVAG